MRSSELARGFAQALKDDWRSIARPNQIPPTGNWGIWLLLAGRGFGKTRVLSEWVLEQVQTRAAGRIALVGATAGDVRDILVEGESGILRCAPKRHQPQFEPSKRRIVWPNGAIATCYSADEPDRLRGQNSDAAACDELAAWRYVEAWEMLLFGLRIGANPRCVVATTPKPTRLLKELVSREGKDVVITRGKTRDNEKNLAPRFLQEIVSRYAGTRMGRQELDGELLTDTPGALWSASVLEETRVATAPALQRVVVALDPSGSGGENADEAGIVVAALGLDGHGYALSDLSDRLAPPEWARRAIEAYRAHRADRLVAEVNFGAGMVTATIAAVDPTVPVKTITSSRGKVLRAEPIAAFFDQGRAHLVGAFPELEDQMTSFTTDYNRARDGSPGRVDALVFALTELMLGQPLGGFFREASLLVDGVPVEVPQKIDGVFAVIGTSAKVGPDGDGLGVVYFGICGHARSPLTVLDWSVEIFDGSEAWLPSVFQRLEELRTECRALVAGGGVWIEDTPIGATLLRLGETAELDVHVIDSDAVPIVPAERAIAVSRWVGGGDLKLTRGAHEKLVTFRGVTRNHLVGQILGFGVGTEPPDATELLNPFCAGAILALDGRTQ